MLISYHVVPYSPSAPDFQLVCLYYGGLRSEVWVWSPDHAHLYPLRAPVGPRWHSHYKCRVTVGLTVPFWRLTADGHCNEINCAVWDHEPLFPWQGHKVAACQWHGTYSSVSNVVDDCRNNTSTIFLKTELLCEMHSMKIVTDVCKNHASSISLCSNYKSEDLLLRTDNMNHIFKFLMEDPMKHYIFSGWVFYINVINSCDHNN
jgi:hypothetical protein